MCKRIFLVGAGFSKAVANAPLANEFIGPIYEKAIDNTLHKDHQMWNRFRNEYIRVIKHLEKSVEHQLKFLESNGTQIENRSGMDFIKSLNIELLCTFLDLNIDNPFIPMGRGVDLQGCPIPFIEKMYVSDLKDAQRFIRHHIIESLLPSNLSVNKIVLNHFSEFIKPDDTIFTYNYDLLLEQALWRSKLWNPIDGYELGIIDDYLNVDEDGQFKTMVPIIKLHGSINWQQPSFFNQDVQIFVTDPFTHEPYFDSFKFEFKVKRNNRLRLLNSHFITPTYMKKFESKYEIELIRMATEKFKNCTELYVLGYSFPDADSLTSFLMTQLPTNLSITIIDLNAKEISRNLCEKYGFNENNVRPEQSKIDDWINNNFELLAYSDYIEKQKMFHDIMKYSE